jgi:hypothetical protein
MTIAVAPTQEPTPSRGGPESRGIRLLYLHGFASSPDSSKAVRFAEHASLRFSLEIERLDLRVPSFEHLRLSEMIRVVRERIGGRNERVVVMGSSLGGLTAAHVAAADPRVCGLVLLAPAFRIAQTWERRLGPELQAWKENGWREVDDHAKGGKSRVDFAFYEELNRMTRVLPEVRVPTLIIHGEKDDVVPPSASAELAEGRPHIQRLVVDDGHELRAMEAWLPAVDHFLSPYFGPPAS